MARPPKQQPIDITALFKDAGEKLAQVAREPNILLYKPHHKQELFHKANDYARLYIGGNRSGKTFSAVVEDIWWATGKHPYQKTPPTPVRGRVVGVDFKEGVNLILLPLFKRLIAPSDLINGSWDDSYNSQLNLLTFDNGSTIEFMSYEQDTAKFAGTSRHFVHFDEEPPKNVFDECMLRLLDVEGHYWVSMTPVEGITWLWETIYEPATESVDSIIVESSAPMYGQVVRNEDMETLIVEVDQRENPYLTELGQKRALSLLSEDDRRARQEGKFVEMSGLIYKTFSPDVHVIPQGTFNPPKEWDWYMSVDHGWNNPTAVLWHVVSPDGTVYTFSEHYASNMTIAEHSATIHLREQAWGRAPDLRVGDPAMKQTNGITGTSIIQEYGDRGIHISVEYIPRDVQIGIARIQQYLRVDTVTNKPKWYITDNCVNLIREMRRLRWKKYASKKMQHENNKPEQIHKKDDHACDSARYFFTCMPELSSADYDDPNGPSPEEIGKESVSHDFGAALLRALTEDVQLDEVISTSDNSERIWDIYEGFDLSY